MQDSDAAEEAAARGTTSPPRLRRLAAFYNQEETSLWPELIAQAEKGHGPLVPELKALEEDGYEMATEPDEDSIPNAASPPECKEMMNGAGGDGPLTPMSDTTTVVLGDEVPEKTDKTDRKKKLEDVGQALEKNGKTDGMENVDITKAPEGLENEDTTKEPEAGENYKWS